MNKDDVARAQIRNEFAVVDLEIQPTYGGTVLLIRDIQTGAAIALDALEVEALTRLTHADLGFLVDPSFEPWSSRAANDQRDA